MRINLIYSRVQESVPRYSCSTRVQEFCARILLLVDLLQYLGIRIQLYLPLEVPGTTTSRYILEHVSVCVFEPNVRGDRRVKY